MDEKVVKYLESVIELSKTRSISNILLELILKDSPVVVYHIDNPNELNFFIHQFNKHITEILNVEKVRIIYDSNGIVTTVTIGK